MESCFTQEMNIKFYDIITRVIQHHMLWTTNTDEVYDLYLIPQQTPY